MASCSSSGAVQAAIREKSRQNRSLERGDVYGALRCRNNDFPRAGMILPRPTRWDGGGRVWVFSSK